MQLAPTGSRRVTANALKARQYHNDGNATPTRSELAKILKKATRAMNLRPSLRLVLNELVGAWGETVINDKLMVWPSNEFLVDRTGLSERSIRYAIRCLTDMKLIATKDSANGKRFAIKNKTGQIIDVYGFDLTPLKAREAEFDVALSERDAHKQRVKRVYDQITIYRRSALEALRELSDASCSDIIADMQSELDNLQSITPKRCNVDPGEDIVRLWKTLTERIEINLIESGCGGNDNRHIETNKDSDSLACQISAMNNEDDALAQALSPAFIRAACPALAAYLPSHGSNWSIVQSAKWLRSVLAAHESVWDEGVMLIGSFRTSLCVILVLQMYENETNAETHRIKNPGGYLRSMIRMVSDGKISLAREFASLKLKS